MASSPKDKFEAAVQVIRGLPKNGSFQPSHDLMLKFYSYFKQATEGPCTSPKPSFWDLVNRKKWDAWSNLGNMEGEQAMLLYVEELKKIVETMPQTVAVTKFLQKLDHFYELVEDSENHNSLKQELEKSAQPNGSLNPNGTPESDEEENEANHSANLTELLKQDMKRSGDTVPHVKVNGLNGNHDSDDSLPEAETDVREDHLNQYSSLNERDRETEEEEEEYDDNDEEEEEEGKTSQSHSASVSGDETENEEFCDTSDEPIEVMTQSMIQSMALSVPPRTETLASSSTPNNNAKSVHFGHEGFHTEALMTESMVVNPPEQSCGNISSFELSASGHSFLGLTKDSDTVDLTAKDSGRLDITTCRGEDDDRDRRRRGQGSRNVASSGTGGSGYPEDPQGSGTENGSGSRRGLFPGASGGGGRRGHGSGKETTAGDLNEQIVVTLLRLQHDMSGVLNRLNSLEALVKEGRNEKERKNRVSKGWWPFPELTAKSAFVIFAWPLVVHCILAYLSRRRRKLNR